MRTLAAVILLLAATAVGVAGEQVNEDMKTVIGPRNPELKDGADALLAGRAERGVELTLIGLERARGAYERQAALSNLCAGYVMLRDYNTAIDYCDQALAENGNNWRALSNRALAHTELGEFDAALADLDRGQSIMPKSRKLKEVRGWVMDRMDPVAPSITIDDRRDGPDEQVGPDEPDV